MATSGRGGFAAGDSITAAGGPAGATPFRVYGVYGVAQSLVALETRSCHFQQVLGREPQHPPPSLVCPVVARMTSYPFATRRHVEWIAQAYGRG
jgi:hypothetical protein